MPYLDTVRKLQLDEGVPPESPGDLTYLLTKACLDYLEGPPTVRFAHFAEVLGSLEATKLELGRRVLAPYEEGRASANGDIFKSLSAYITGRENA